MFDYKPERLDGTRWSTANEVIKPGCNWGKAVTPQNLIVVSSSSLRTAPSTDGCQQHLPNKAYLLSISFSTLPAHHSENKTSFA